MKQDNQRNKFRPGLWIIGIGLLVIIGLGSFFYFRTSSFVNDTMGAYNAPSLLKTTPTAAPVLPSTPTPLSIYQSGLTPTIVPPTATPLPPSPTATPTNYPAIVQRIQRGERVSALVVGYGGAGHDGAFLGDTLLVVSYDPLRKAVTLINIPRDMYAFIPYGGPKVGFYSKVNAAFAYVMDNSNASGLAPRYRYTNDLTKIDAAANLTKDIVEDITGIPIDYWVTMNFNAFRKLIDAIGGIEVNVETTFDDYEYPTNDDASIDASVMHIHFNAGLTKMNGERAIQYTRSRKSLQDGSDFNRSKRQMKVVQAVKEKMTRPDVLLKSLDIMDALQGNLRTSLNFSEARGLVDYFRSSEGTAKTANITFVQEILSDKNLLSASESADTGYILIPDAGQGNYKEIQDWLRTGMLAPEIRIENLKVQIQNGTGLTKPLTAATDDLKARGFTLLQPIWANTTLTTQIIDYSEGKGHNTIQALTTMFPFAQTRITSRPAEYYGPDIVVVLGQDYTNKSLPNNASKPIESINR